MFVSKYSYILTIFFIDRVFGILVFFKLTLYGVLDVITRTPDVLIDAIVLISLLFRRDLNAHVPVDIVHNLRVQVRSHNDRLLLHLLKVLVRLLVVLLVEVVLNELGKDVTESDSLIDSRRVDQLIAYLHGSLGVSSVQQFPCLDELLDGVDSLSHHGQLSLFISGVRLL